MKKIYTILTALTFMAGAFGEGYFLNRLGACSDADGTEFGKELFTINEAKLSLISWVFELDNNIATNLGFSHKYVNKFGK